MSGKSTIFVEELTYLDLDLLERLKISGDDRLCETARAIELSKSGKSAQEIVAILGIDYQVILRIIKEFNRKGAVYLRDLLQRHENRWTREKVVRLLAEYHRHWFEHDREEADFNFRYIRSVNPALESAIYSNERLGIGSLKNGFELAGINPYCHLKKIPYDRAKFIELLQYIASELGVESLNDRSMNRGDRFLPPPSWMGDRSYPECEKLGCPLIGITFQSVYTKGRRLFGDWESALKAAGYTYETIRRKKPKYPREAVMRDLLEFDMRANGRWHIQDLRDQNYALYKGIYNSDSDSVFGFANWLPMPTAYLELQYLKRKADGLEFTPEEFFKAEGARIRQTFETDIRAQQSWSTARLRLEVLRRFATGVRLNRAVMESSDNRDDRTLLASLRRYYDGDYKKALRRCGVDLDQLTRIYREMDDPFPPEKVHSEIKKLLLESIEAGESRLSRKYVSAFHPDLEQAAIRHYKSWQNALRRTGLVPSMFELSASERTRKGLQFQEFIREFLVENGFNQVKNHRQIESRYDFVYNKHVPSCKHKPRCKPDFFFANWIWDAKIGGNAERQLDQLERYLEHTSDLLIITIADSPKSIQVDGQNVDVIGFEGFLKLLKDRFGIVTDDSEKQRLSEELHVISFSEAS